MVHKRMQYYIVGVCFEMNCVEVIFNMTTWKFF